MYSPTAQPRSLATKASWTSLGLAVGCVCAIIMSVAICIVCGVAAILGCLLLIGEKSRPVGYQILQCSVLSLFTGLFFAWAGLFLLAGAPLALWAN